MFKEFQAEARGIRLAAKNSDGSGCREADILGKGRNFKKGS